MTKHSRRYEDAVRRFDPSEFHLPLEAIELVKSLASANFDETVDAAFKLGIDPRKADQAVRGTVSLPHGTGKSVRVAVFAEGDPAREASEAGADLVGSGDLAEEIQAGNLDFDVLIAAPDMMATVGKLGKILGPRGLMPNPKSGTVTFEVGQAVNDFKAGKLEYRNDRNGNVHVHIGKVSFEAGALLDNYSAVIEELSRVRPASAKGRYIQSVTLSSTMGPGVKIDPLRAKPEKN